MAGETETTHRFPGGRAALGIASVAASTATLGDLVMLYVAGSQRPELGITPPAPWLLWLGAGLGVIAIPFYALGYRAVAAALSSESSTLSRVVLYCGYGAAGVGAIIHGATALLIRAELRAGLPGKAPMDAVGGGGALLIVLWAIAATLVVIASLAILRAGLTAASSMPVWWAWLNPSCVTAALVGVGLPFELGRSFLVPAAPNVAHIVLFAASFAALDPHARQRLP